MAFFTGFDVFFLGDPSLPDSLSGAASPEEEPDCSGALAAAASDCSCFCRLGIDPALKAGFLTASFIPPCFFAGEDFADLLCLPFTAVPAAVFVALLVVALPLPALVADDDCVGDVTSPVNFNIQVFSVTLVVGNIVISRHTKHHSIGSIGPQPDATASPVFVTPEESSWPRMRSFIRCVDG